MASASAMVADSANAYWIEPGKDTNGNPYPAYNIVWQCTLGGCGGSPTVLGANFSATDGGVGASGADAIAVDSTNVYWADTQGVVKCAIGGCGNNPTRLSTPPATSLAIGGTSIYGTYYGDPAHNIVGFVWQCPTSGCSSGYTTIYKSQGSPDHIFLIGPNLFWSDTDGIKTCPATGCGGAPITFASNGCMTSLTADSTNVYWSGCGPVMKAPITGGNPTLVATGATSPGIALDSMCVYYSATSGVMMTPK